MNIEIKALVRLKIITKLYKDIIIIHDENE